MTALATLHAQSAVPPRALAISAAALSVPALASGSGAAFTSEYEVLLWLLALVPAFLLAYYRGWRGSASALAAGMAALTVAQVAVNFSGGRTLDPLVLLQLVAVFIAVSLGVGWIAEMLHHERDRASILAHTDPGTGLPNRRLAMPFLEERVAHAAGGTPLAVLFFDLDHFKAYNDGWGHRAGDEALAAVGRVLGRMTGPEDLSARWGGEEFVTVLRCRNGAAASAFAHRVAWEIKRLPLPGAPLTVSVGMAFYGGDTRTPEALLEAADAALYEAKAAGRNCVRIHGSCIDNSQHVAPRAAQEMVA